MKWVSALILVALIYSCEKTNNTSLIGKWKMVEFYVVAPQSCLCWREASYEDILELSVTGKYRINKTPPASSIGIACPGTFRLVNQSIIAFIPNCRAANPVSEVIGTYSQSTKQLTVEFYYFSQVIRKLRYVKLQP